MSWQRKLCLMTISLLICISPAIVMWVCAWGTKEAFIHSISRMECGAELEWEEIFWRGKDNTNVIVGLTWGAMALSCPSIIIFRSLVGAVRQYIMDRRLSVRFFVLSLMIVLFSLMFMPIARIFGITGFFFFQFNLT